ncbi:unnamed protein product [Lactuca saligna]|uniref:Uncharacterized protein n=1 Tax=Lactuca saligna TaxID=75948 RepID=A0AA36EMK3_LACSI|nr:unnamed protein product [Lactuca saligna]
MGRTSDIPKHTSHVDSNVNMGEKSTIDSSTVIPPSDSPFKVSLHKYTSDFPTYVSILTQPITTLFSSQSTDQGKGSPHPMEEYEYEGFGFGELTFYPKEEYIADEALMSRK